MIITIDTAKTAVYKEAIIKLKAILEKLPKENICAHKIKGRYRYYLRHNNSEGKTCEKYLSEENSSLIKDCCESKYLKKLIPALERELKAIQYIDRNYAPHEKIESWHNLSEAYKRYANQMFFSNEEICKAWENENYATNPLDNPYQTQYISKKGDIVRSRIELIIADILYDLGIAYRYECRLDLASGAIYPDFTIMHPKTLELYYIEIFGMMDNPEYAKNAFSKIAKYAASGYYAHLIMFFDHKDAPISPANIKSVLTEKFS